MNILAVGAHYDDVELGCSGALLRHVAAKDRVTVLVVTDSAYKNHEGQLIRSSQTALNEAKTAAGIIRAELICLNYKTFEVPFDEQITRDIMHQIETLDIDVIFSHWTHDLHRDHQHVGKATLMAGRHVPRFLMYRSNFYDTEEQFRGNFYVDISDQIEKKKRVIMAHQSELERVRYKWLDFVLNQNANDGQKIGVAYAERFEIVRYLK